MLKTCFLWQLTSTSLYKKFNDNLILPSCSHLRQLSAGMNLENHTIDLNYLKARTIEWTSKERIVVLLVDEVYTAQRIEYNDGYFVGLTNKGKPAKTCICGAVSDWKIQRYCLFSASIQIDTVILHYWFDFVLDALDTLFSVVAISVDNHICNR